MTNPSAYKNLGDSLSNMEQVSNPPDAADTAVRQSSAADDVRSSVSPVSTAGTQVRVIKPRAGWRSIDFGELWRYRDLAYYLVWRDIKARYAQSILGIGWAVIQPLFMMIVFSIVFGRLAEIDSDGTPYPIFTYIALVPWTFFSNSLTQGTASLTKNAEMLKKVYIPRLLMPLSAVTGKLVDFVIAFTLLGGMMLWYDIVPTWWAFTMPLLVLLLMLTASGMGMLLAALAVQYRDISYGMNFGVQALMFAAPVVYPASSVPEQWRLVYALNPMVGVIEGFRSAFLGTNPMPWDFIGIGLVSAIVIAFVGAIYFRRMEKIFADVA